MRIALLSHEYPPFVGGGIGTYTAAAAHHLGAAGHEVHVVTNAATFGSTRPEHAVPLWREGNIVVHRLPLFDERYRVAEDERCFGEDPRAFAWPMREVVMDPSHLAAVRIADHVAALHREHPFDVVEAPDCMAEAFYLVRRRRAGQPLPPVVVHAHGSSREVYRTAEDPQRLGTACIRGRIAREDACLEQADALLAPSSAILARYDDQHRGALPALRATVPYYFDPPGASAPPACLPQQPFLLAIGRVEPRKGVDVALAAFALLAQEFPALRLVFCGDADAWRYGESFAALAARTLPESARQRLVLLGAQPRGAAFAALQRASVLLHAARWDNWPNAVLEAMAAGAPCVVSAAGGQAEMIEHGRSGLVVPPDDPVALADAARRILRAELPVDALRAAARARLLDLTSPGELTARKVRFFAEVAAAASAGSTARAAAASATSTSASGRSATAVEPPRADARGAAAVPGVADTGAAATAPELVGAGLLLVDADAAHPDAVAQTLAALAPVVAASPAWRGALLSSAPVPAQLHNLHFPQRRCSEVPPWLELGDDCVLVYAKGGACPDPGRVRALTLLLAGAPRPAGAFVWLRAQRPGFFFPHRPDCGWRDLLLRGGTLPPVFAVPTAALRAGRTLVGLTYPEARIAALAALAGLHAGRRLVHTGELGGVYHGDHLTLWEDAQQRAVGWLDLWGALPRGGLSFGDIGLVDRRLLRLRQLQRRWQASEEGREHARRSASAVRTP